MTSPLIKWRSSRQLTQVEAAEMAKVSQPTWARWEAGRVGYEHCQMVHKLTGIALHILRPDIYPTPQRRASDKAGAQ